MRNFFVCIITLFTSQISLASDLSPESLKWLKNNPHIKVGFEETYAPIEMKLNDAHSGISGAYIDYFRKNLPSKFSSHSKPTWAETFQAAVNREYDVLSCVLETESRKENFLFTKPYISLDTAIITSKMQNFTDASIEDFHGKKLAVVRGYFWKEILSSEHPQIELVFVNSFGEGLMEVAFGSVDAFFGAMAPATHYMSEHKITNLRVSGVTPYQINYSFGVRKDWPELVDILNQLIDQMPAKQKTAIESQWITMEHYQIDRYSAYLKFSFIVVFLLTTICLVIWFWNITLRKRILSHTKELKEVNLSLESRVLKRTKALDIANNRLLESQKELKKVNEELIKIASNDGLTKIANRRMFDDFMYRFFSDSNTSCLPYSFFMIDVDFFKSYNDLYGHQKGDEALQKVASQLAKGTRRELELAARFGGEEFALMITNCDEELAQKIADKKRSAVEALEIKHEKSEVGQFLTISIGYVSIPANSQYTQEQVINMADKALYQAKFAGRNRIYKYRD